jgi:hypothetical protein
VITVDAYIRQHLAGHEDELTEDIQTNAAIVCDRANQLLVAFGEDRGLRSGWRPAAVNSGAGGATHSRHMTGQACDIEDNDGSLDAWCKENVATLESIGLWLEIDTATPTWCHVQCVPPNSGRRFFIP